MHKCETTCGGARRSAGRQSRAAGTAMGRGARCRGAKRRGTRCRGAGWLAVYIVAVAVVLAVTPAAEAVTPVGQATVSREAREQAIRSIPFQELDEGTRQKLTSVLSNPTIYRRLPTRTISCDPDMYVFLVRHPEVVVSIWELMGVTNVKVQRTGQYTMRASDGAGTITDVELIYGSRDQHVVYAEGYYDGPMTRKKLTGRCVMLLSSAYEQDESQQVHVISQLDVFLQLDNVGADLLARTLHPIVGRTADHNFLESAGFLAQLSAAAETNAAGVQRLSERLTQVDPAVRTRFASLAAVAQQRATMRREMLEGGNADFIASGREADPARLLPAASVREADAGPQPARRRGDLELRR